MLVALAMGCERAPSAVAPVAMVGERPVHQSVIDMVATRDGLEPEGARAYVEQTLRLAQAARDQAKARSADPPPLIRPDREAHIVRAALARVWLDDVFEPAHRFEDIPLTEPSYVAAITSQRYVHPKIHLLCQVVAVPAGEFDNADALAAAAADPAWKARAWKRLGEVGERMRRNVVDDDPGACKLMAALLTFETPDKDGVLVKLEQGGFELDACAVERSPDGKCSAPRWAAEWVDEVAKATGPGLLPPFESRFGAHLVFVTEILPKATAEDPQTVEAVRQAVGPQWQHAAFEQAIDRLAEQRAVRQVAGAPP